MYSDHRAVKQATKHKPRPTTTLTMHTLSQCKTWSAYHAAYLSWMQKHNHPDLRKSNWKADCLRYELRFPPIPILEVPEIYDHRPP